MDTSRMNDADWKSLRVLAISEDGKGFVEWFLNASALRFLDIKAATLNGKRLCVITKLGRAELLKREVANVE